MSNIKKLMMSAAGGAGLNIEEVFSTYLWTGDQTARNIVNGIDLATEGGLVWIKNRDTAGMSHSLVDTERGANKILTGNTTGVEINSSGAYGVNGFNTNGFSLPSGEGAYYENKTGKNAVGWTFRKAPKFFDVVTWTGNGQSTQTIPHSLGSAPGFITIKATGLTQNWWSYHRSLGTGQYLTLNTSNAAASGSIVTATSASNFTVGSTVTSTGYQYVAYIFAHNNGDGGFGPDGNQDIIKCGSYTGTGHPSNNSLQQTIELGFEPQWFLTKRTNSGASWQLVDNMRSMADEYRRIYPDQSAVEDYESDGMRPTPTGIRFTGGQPTHNASGGTYIYIAIRRGPMAVPESATDVFAPNFYGTSGYEAYLGAPADMTMLSYLNGGSQNAIIRTRMLLSSKGIVTNSASSQTNVNSTWDNMVGVSPVGTTYSHLLSFTWRRAPGYLDIVNYIGTGANRTISHNLGAVPKMMWIKCIDSAEEWCVYHSGVGATKFLTLNQNYGTQTNSQRWNNTTPTDTQFSLGSHRDVNRDDQKYVAYLFGEVSGISKMGSYTGNGQAQVIDCGFTAGARFVMIKRTNTTSDWFVFDTARGITSGNDSRLMLNLGAGYPAVTNTDFIDPNNSGFALQAAYTTVNNDGDEYIFYAIA